jgi:hypothetical protein
MHWLNDKSFIILFLIKLLAEVIHLLREDPSLREKVIFSWEDFGHSHKIPRQIILSR